MKTFTINTPDTAQLAPEHTSIAAEAAQLEVLDKQTHGVGLELLKTVASAEKRVIELFKEPKAAAHKSHKFLTDLEKQMLRPILEAKTEITKKLTIYEDIERKKADDEARRLSEEARQKEIDRKLSDAVSFEKAGDQKTAAEILEEPITTPVISVRPELAAAAGVSDRVTYKAEVTNVHELVKYVAAHPEWLTLIEPCMPQLNSLARAQRENLKVPGVKVIREVIKAIRSA